MSELPFDIHWSEFPTDDMFKGLTPHDFVGMTIPDLSYEMHLSTMKGIVRRGREGLADVGRRLDELNARGQEHGLDERDQDYRGELFYEHMFLASANSLVASALMASFLDRFFSALFKALKGRNEAELRAKNPGHVRWTMRDGPWLPAKATVPGRGPAFGLNELSEAIGMSLPPRFLLLYDALTTYRNNTLHDSLEWDTARLAEMSRRIVDRGWDPTWFDVTTVTHPGQDAEPRMYALEDRFVDEMLAGMDEMLVAVGQFLKDLR